MKWFYSHEAETDIFSPRGEHDEAAVAAGDFEPRRRRPRELQWPRIM